MAKDRYGGANPGLSSPFVNGFDVVPADFVDVQNTTRGLWVGTGGNVRVVWPDGTESTFKNVPGGSYLPVRAMRVNATGTTASDILGLY